MDNKPRDKKEIIYCPPGHAIGYKADIASYSNNQTEDSSTSEASNYERLWIAVIREHLNDLKPMNSKGETNRQVLESFHWLFRDKRTFPTVSAFLGYDYREFRKSLIRFVRAQKADQNFDIANKNYYVNLKKQTEKIMKALENLTYTELQKLAKEKGLSCKGLKKEALIQVIQENALKDLQETDLGQSRPKQVEPRVSFVKSTLITDLGQMHEIAPRSMKIALETQGIIEKCNAVFQSSRYPDARAKLSTSGEGLDFTGGPKQVQWVTLHQPEKTILYFAHFYVQKMVVEKTRVDENGEEIFISERR